MPCCASPLASILLNSFRVQTFLCKVRSSVFLLLCHARFMVKFGSYRFYHVWIACHGSVKAVESESESSIHYHDQHTRISSHSLDISFWTKPWHLLFPVAKLVQAAYCKYQSLIPWIFSKTFPTVAFRKTFPAWRWNNSVITCLIAILANFDGNVKNKCFTSKIQCHEENGKFFCSYWFCR